MANPFHPSGEQDPFVSRRAGDWDDSDIGSPTESNMVSAGMPDDWGDVKRVPRVSRGKIAVFFVILAICGAVGAIWYIDTSKRQAWEKELRAAMTLPDGQFEAAMRGLLEKSDDVEILSQAIFELGAVKDKQAAPLLIKLLAHQGKVSQEAAMSLAKIGGENAAASIDAIHAQMEKAIELPRAKYAWALCTLGDARGFAPLLEAVMLKFVTPKSLPEFNPDIFARLGTTDRLIDMAAAPDPMLQVFAANELGYRRDKDPVPALIKLVSSDNLKVAEAAGIALGRTADPKAGQALIAAMEKKDAIKMSILNSIAQTVGAPGLEIVYKNSKRQADKFDIVAKLKTLKDPRSKDFLVSVIGDPDSAPKTEFNATSQMKEAEKAAEATRQKEVDTYSQALWTLEELGDKRIGGHMLKKAFWEPITEAQLADATVRYRQNDMARRIANDIAVWFGKMKPEGVYEDLMKIYEANAPYSNTPECAQRVKVDIGPLLEGMGRTGDQRFCPTVEPFIDQEEGFYRQAAVMAYSRLKCPGALANLEKRIPMTAQERKDEKFAPLIQDRDIAMEDRLQERRNSIIAMRWIADTKVADTLMKVIMDLKDDQELRSEAALAIPYCADATVMQSIVSKIKDTKTDLYARIALLQGLRTNPAPEALEVVMGVLETPGGVPELYKSAAIVMGEAADPKYEDRLNKLLDSADENQQRGAFLAVMLGGNTSRVDKLAEVLGGEENGLVLRGWYELHPFLVTKQMFENKRVYKRLLNAKALADYTTKKGSGVVWPLRYLASRLKSGCDDSPFGLMPQEIRELLAQTVREDTVNQRLAIHMLEALVERGYLLALQSESGPHGLVVRNFLSEATRKL